MDEDARHAERVGNGTGVLASGATEAAQHIFGDVVPALNRDVFDRVGHVFHRDPEETLGDFLGGAHMSCRGSQLLCHEFEFLAHGIGVERQIGARPENFGEKRRIYLADHDVAVGHGQRTAAAIRRGTWIRTRRLRADAKARSVEAANGAAARSHRVDAHHRCAQANTCDLGVEGSLVLPGIVRDVGRSSTHVEADDLLKARLPRHLNHAYDASGGAGQDGILPLKPMRIGQPAGRLHELEPRL